MKLILSTLLLKAKEEHGYRISQFVQTFYVFGITDLGKNYVNIQIISLTNLCAKCSQECKNRVIGRERMRKNPVTLEGCL